MKPSAPPTISGLCASDREYLWTVSSLEAGLGEHPGIDYTTKRTSDWAYPNGVTEAWLDLTSSGGHAATIRTSKADGAILYVRWTAYPEQVASGPAAPTAACAMASLTVRRVIQGGTATAARFPVTAARSVFAFIDPALSETIATPVTSDAVQSVQPGGYAVGPTKEAGAYVDLPAGYVWRSTACATTVPGQPGALAGTTTDARYQRLTNDLAPGGSLVCTITYHYGPVLEDTIAAGKVTAGTTGFKTATITVKKGTYVTYLVATSPSLAGRKVQIWTRSGSTSKPWKLTKTVTVASDGSVRYYTRVSALTWFLAKWPGDADYVASQATGRYVKVT